MGVAEPMKRLIADILVSIYRLIFARKMFYHFNKLVFHLSLRGLGILNYENDKVSGEDSFLRRLAKTMDKPLILDIGANIGNYSNKVKSFCPGATIYAFEPHPKTFAQLRSEASRNGYTAINAGCGDKEVRVQLYDYKGDKNGSQHASLYGEAIEEFRKAETQSYTVDMTTIDDFVSRNGLQKIHLLKLDIEGNELRAIEGAKASIAAGLIDIIQFEFNEMNVLSRCFFRDFYKVLPEYNLYRTLPDGLLPLGPYDALTCELFAYQNIVAIRAGRGEPL